MISSVAEHYDNLLAEHYDWMCGLPFEAKVAEQKKLLEEAGVRAAGGGNGTPDGAIAVDLGCGSGYQSLALSELGYRVIAVDSSGRLLHDLEARVASRPIETRAGDILQLDSFSPPGGADLIVCMGDTLTHLSRRQEVSSLFRSVERALKPGGAFVLSYRDLASSELIGLDRFIPVRGDADRVMTCFLEYEGPATVIVNDLIHVREEEGRWRLHKSCYRKLRLAIDWIRDELRLSGLSIGFERIERMAVLAAWKSSAPLTSPPAGTRSTGETAE